MFLGDFLENFQTISGKLLLTFNKSFRFSNSKISIPVFQFSCLFYFMFLLRLWLQEKNPEKF